MYLYNEHMIHSDNVYDENAMYNCIYDEDKIMRLYNIVQNITKLYKLLVQEI